MKYFLNYDNYIYSFKIENQTIKLYKEGELILFSKTKLRDITLPVEPIYVSGCLILFDYDKGIEIIRKDGSYSYIKLLAIHDGGILNDKLIVFSFTKMYLINYLNGDIIEKINISENFRFLQNSDYALFYRFKYNYSYLYDKKNKQVIDLGNKFPFKEFLLLQIATITDGFAIVGFLTIGKDKMFGTINYDFKTKDFVNELYYNDCSCLGALFANKFAFKINENIHIDTTNYGKFVMTLFEKYGIYFTFYFCNKNKIMSLKNTPYEWIYECYLNYSSFWETHFKPRLVNDYDELFRNLSDISEIFKKHI